MLHWRVGISVRYRLGSWQDLQTRLPSEKFEVLLQSFATSRDASMSTIGLIIQQQTWRPTHRASRRLGVHNLHSEDRPHCWSGNLKQQPMFKRCNQKHVYLIATAPRATRSLLSFVILLPRSWHGLNGDTRRGGMSWLGAIPPVLSESTLESS